MSGPSPLSGERRSVRSFVVRAGRLTTGQAKALSQHWPTLGLEYSPAALDLDHVFGRRAARVLEIGFGNGDHLAALAEAHPDRDYLGIEVHPPGVGHLLQLAAARQISNLRVSCHDAVEVLCNQLTADSLDEVLILFPDPWHKKRHHKRRLVQVDFLALLATRLKPGGILRMATDWVPYAQHMLECLRHSPQFENLSPTGDYVPRDPERGSTRFERRGQRLGHEVRDIAARRR